MISKVQEVPAQSGEDMLCYDEIPASPPLEVLAGMLAAARTYESLSSCGLELGYCEEDYARVTLEVRNAAGIVVRTLGPAEAVALACGESLTERGEEGAS